MASSNASRPNLLFFRQITNETWPTMVCSTKRVWGDFPGDAVVKNLPANVGDTGSIPGPGRSHMLRSN